MAANVVKTIPQRNIINPPNPSRRQARITLRTEAATRLARRASSQFRQINPTSASHARISSRISNQKAVASTLITRAAQRATSWVVRLTFVISTLSHEISELCF
jgi:hypothetical protein